MQHNSPAARKERVREMLDRSDELAADAQRHSDNGHYQRAYLLARDAEILRSVAGRLQAGV